MTYFESAEEKVISRKRAVQELLNHGVVDVNEFFADCGDRPVYSAEEVLIWLGY